jgi:mono/diheme cytochrome c family protein
MAGAGFAQQRTGPTGPPLATENPNYEGKGNFDWLSACAICHGRIEQAPPLAELQKLSPEQIYRTMTTGAMKSQAERLRDEQRTRIA